MDEADADFAIIPVCDICWRVDDPRLFEPILQPGKIMLVPVSYQEWFTVGCLGQILSKASSFFS